MKRNNAVAHSEAAAAEEGNAFEQRTDKQKSVTLKWENLYYSISQGNKGKVKLPEKCLLENVSGIVNPGEVVAIMGASGAGKTMLLNVLAGRIKGGTIQGDILINGQPRDPKTWRKKMAYVEQDDLMYQNLTVRETLCYAAKLRLPETISEKERMERVDQVVNQLSLRKCLNTRIGDSELRGISGGERKRVSIGIEMVTKPRLLFLDEPTSGLDAFTASNIVECIKELAEKEKCTVLMTIHQPREYILSLFTKIILLSQGKVVYFGDLKGAVAHFENCGFPVPPQCNPSDFFLDTMTVDYRSEELLQKSQNRVMKLQNSWKMADLDVVKISNDHVQVDDRQYSQISSNSFLREFRILLGRALADEFRDKGTIGATLGQAFTNTLLLGFIYWQISLDDKGAQNIVGALFFIAINLTFGNVMPTMAVFVQQRQIMRRELAAGSYRPISAYLSKIVAQLPLVLISTILFAVPVYWMIGLYPHLEQFLTFICIVVVHAMVASMMGIMISSGVSNVRIGQIFGPMIIVIFLLFGGQFVNVNSTPVVLRWIKWLSVIYYSYQAMAQNELNYVTFECEGSPFCFSSGKAVLKQLNLDEVPIWYCVLINACMGLVYVGIGYFLFRWRSQPLLKLK